MVSGVRRCRRVRACHDGGRGELRRSRHRPRAIGEEPRPAWRGARRTRWRTRTAGALLHRTFHDHDEHTPGRVDVLLQRSALEYDSLARSATVQMVEDVAVKVAPIARVL